MLCCSVPVGLEDVSKYPYLFAELINRGYSDDELIAIAGGNLMRVFRKVESVSKSFYMYFYPTEAIHQSKKWEHMVYS